MDRHVGVSRHRLRPRGVDAKLVGARLSLTPPGAARTAAPAAWFIARSVLAGGASVVAICPRPSPLAGPRTKGLRILSGVPDAAEVTTELGRTKGPLAVLVDDAEALARTPVDDAVRDAVHERGHGTTTIVSPARSTISRANCGEPWSRPARPNRGSCR